MLLRVPRRRLPSQFTPMQESARLSLNAMQTGVGLCEAVVVERRPPDCTPRLYCRQACDLGTSLVVVPATAVLAAPYVHVNMVRPPMDSAWRFAPKEKARPAQLLEIATSTSDVGGAVWELAWELAAASHATSTALASFIMGGGLPDRAEFAARDNARRVELCSQLARLADVVHVVECQGVPFSMHQLGLAVATLESSVLEECDAFDRAARSAATRGLVVPPESLRWSMVTTLRLSTPVVVATSARLADGSDMSPLPTMGILPYVSLASPGPLAIRRSKDGRPEAVTSLPECNCEVEVAFCRVGGDGAGGVEAGLPRWYLQDEREHIPVTARRRVTEPSGRRRSRAQVIAQQAGDSQTTEVNPLHAASRHRREQEPLHYVLVAARALSAGEPLVWTPPLPEGSDPEPPARLVRRLAATAWRWGLDVE